jgi:hypothetical protein
MFYLFLYTRVADVVLARHLFDVVQIIDSEVLACFPFLKIKHTSPYGANVTLQVA